MLCVQLIFPRHKDRAMNPQHRVLARWTGFCAGCPEEAPLLLVSTGAHGLRAWLSGAGPEDRELTYTCAVCGRVEHVPASEEEDAVYDASLPRWPDWVEQVVEPVVLEAAAVPLALDDVFGLAATRLAAEPVPAPVVASASPVVPSRPGTVRIVTLPVQRCSATDLLVAAA